MHSHPTLNFCQWKTRVSSSFSGLSVLMFVFRVVLFHRVYKSVYIMWWLSSFNLSQFGNCVGTRVLGANCCVWPNVNGPICVQFPVLMKHVFRYLIIYVGKFDWNQMKVIGGVYRRLWLPCLMFRSSCSICIPYFLYLINSTIRFNKNEKTRLCVVKSWHWS